MYVYILASPNGRLLATSVKKYGLKQFLKEHKEYIPIDKIREYTVYRSRIVNTWGHMEQMPQFYLDDLLKN